MISASALLMTVYLSAAGAGSPIPVDAKKQLFLDDHLIASKRNMTRQVHPAHKFPGNPVIWPTESWEPAYALTWGSVIRDEGKYKAWYRTPVGVSYAESNDGISWTKPRLDLVPVDGQKTNILLRISPRTDLGGQQGDLPYFYTILGVHRDDRDSDPSRRYKMGFLSIDREYTGPREDLYHPGQRRGLGVAGSPDGIHWKLIDNWTTEAICDGPCHWMLDAARNKYVLYGRTHLLLPTKRKWHDDKGERHHHGGRCVARVESSDFLKWNISEPRQSPVILAADTQDLPGDEIYSMKVFPYESVYIGMVQVFHNRPEVCTLDVQLAVSHDSVHFTRVGNRETFLPLGPIGSWDRFNVSLANNPPIAVDDQLRIYFGCQTTRHNPYRGEDKGPLGGGVGFATVPRDRFVSIGASYDGGEIRTRSLRLLGNSLHINTKSDFGEIVVEVLDANGKRIAKSKAISCDSLDTVVDWEAGSLNDVKGPVALNITFKNAFLFAFWSV